MISPIGAPPKKAMNPNEDHMTPKRITMSTIAEALGVTKTTVSLALRNHPSISQGTTQRVKDLAAKLKYRPDPAISAIATQRWSGGSPERHRVIAFVCQRSPSTITTQMVYLEAARLKAQDLGYKLERFYIDEYPNAQAITRVLYSRGIRGIIIPPIQSPNSKRAANLDWSKFTAVCCGIGRTRPPLHTVTPDTFAHTSLVWNVLKEAGYKRIGAALHCHHPVAHDDWLRIGASSAAIHLLELSESAEIPLYTGDFYDEKTLLAWYDRYRPEVVLGFNESVGQCLERGGVRIPEDTEFVSLMSPPDQKWSGIIHLFDNIAKKSVELLDSEIRHNHWGLPESPTVTLVLPKWNQGSTLRAVPEIVDGKLVAVRSDPKPQLTPV